VNHGPFGEKNFIIPNGHWSVADQLTRGCRGGRRAVAAADADQSPVLGRVLGNVVRGVGPPLGIQTRPGSVRVKPPHNLVISSRLRMTSWAVADITPPAPGEVVSPRDAYSQVGE